MVLPGGVYLGTDRYILFCGLMFVPAFVLSQPSLKVKLAQFGIDLHFAEIFKRTILISQYSGFFFKGARMYVLLGLFPFELVLNQIIFLSLCTEHCCHVCPSG